MKEKARKLFGWIGSLSILKMLTAIWVLVKGLLGLLTVPRIILLVAVVGIALGIGTSELPKLWRDFVFINVAHIKAGESIPFEIEDYSLGIAYDRDYTWGFVTNSTWIVQETSLIVPYFEYEGITYKVNYPRMVYFTPVPGETSLRLLGAASAEWNFLLINDRILFDERWNDERSMLSTLVHELIHLQGELFTSATNPGLSESMTQAATMEVLAAMCNYGDDVACFAFWSDVETFARSSFRTSLNDAGLSWVYDPLANLLWRNAKEEIAAEKTNRYWADDPGERARITKEYGSQPWNKFVLAGLRGIPMNTGNREPIAGSTPPAYKVMSMDFDDTQAMLGILKYLSGIK